jgi:hypothetical protein
MMYCNDYIANRANEDTIQQALANWQTKNAPFIKDADTGKTLDRTPAQVAHTYMERYGHSVDTIRDQIDSEYFDYGSNEKEVYGISLARIGDNGSECLVCTIVDQSLTKQESKDVITLNKRLILDLDEDYNNGGDPMGNKFTQPTNDMKIDAEPKSLNPNPQPPSPLPPPEPPPASEQSHDNHDMQNDSLPGTNNKSENDPLDEELVGILRCKYKIARLTK